MAKHTLNDYDKSIINFYIRGTLSDLSKTFLLFLIFYFLNLHQELLCGVFFLMLFRVFSGGIHCSTYFSCFLLSFAVLSSGVFMGLNMFLSKGGMIPLCILCSIIIICLSPVMSSSRPKLTSRELIITKIKLSIILMGFALTIVFLDTNSYINIGFWILIIHTVQLAVAYVRR